VYAFSHLSHSPKINNINLNNLEFTNSEKTLSTSCEFIRSQQKKKENVDACMQTW
jgi:hypothetical protein